jgi:hypothetical protein
MADSIAQTELKKISNVKQRSAYTRNELPNVSREAYNQVHIQTIGEKKENRLKGLTEEVDDEIRRMEKELNG